MWLALLALLLAAPPGAVAPSARDDLVGALDVHLVAPGESLIELARRYGVGFNEIAAANRRFDPFVPAAGAAAVIPTAWILPGAAAPGTLVVNLSEMRLYLLRAGREPVTFPVGIAVEAGATPLGVLTVVGKEVAPTWYPTPAILAEDPTLPAAVPPGPENPLGSHALRLSRRTILIHGTNRPFGVGRRVSHGCLRLYPEDIPRLFRLVEVGARVAIVREPVKVGVREGRVYVEVHDDETVTLPPMEQAVRLLRRRGVLDRVDPGKLARAVLARSGLPVNVSGDAGRGERATGATAGRGPARPAAGR
jgi:L,D-transpeptidase ErfK/SrfK